MGRLTKRNTNGVAYMAIADTLPKADQEIEGSKTILEALYAMFQKLADYEEKEEKLKSCYFKLIENQKSHGDQEETYTTGYICGHLNGQIELLERILNIDTGERTEEKHG